MASKLVAKGNIFLCALRDIELVTSPEWHLCRLMLFFFDTAQQFVQFGLFQQNCFSAVKFNNNKRGKRSGESVRRNLSYFITSSTGRQQCRYHVDMKICYVHIICLLIFFPPNTTHNKAQQLDLKEETLPSAILGHPPISHHLHGCWGPMIRNKRVECNVAKAEYCGWEYGLGTLVLAWLVYSKPRHNYNFTTNHRLDPWG